MKKTLALLLIFLTLLTCSCTEQTSAGTTEEVTEAPVVTHEDTTYAADTTDAQTSAPEETSAEEIKQQLMSKGFPEDYAVLLTDLQMAYPNWTFNPVNITELSEGKYTWEYVIDAETKDDENNTVDNSMSDALTYAIDDKKVESGIWYRAKVETVEFFMDPRNFLTKQNIFMFENLGKTYGDRTKAVDYALMKTFMYKAVIPDQGNTLTYAQFFSKVGDELGISPIVIATRLRQEQGVEGDSKMITGKTGSVLWQYYQEGSNNAPSEGFTKEQLEAYNGYYNYFNIDATGNGYFNVFLAGRKEAEKNGWTTAQAAIKGGAAKLKSRYIDDHQQTLYFQKFNVDARSKRNFWGQYMQGVDAAYSESRSTYSALAKASLLKLPYEFDIPVYSGMPDTPCPDPGTRYSK